MPLYMLVKVDFGHHENMGLFYSQAKALAAMTAEELKLFDSGSLSGVSFYIEEWYAK